MKKLISVFAALALVGSLAAQKGKKPAKAPVAPKAPAAVAAPVAAVTAMAPAASGAGKGMGLFIDLRGSYTFANGTSSAVEDGTTVAGNVAGGNDLVKTYKTSASQGFGGGISIGYDIAANLGIVAGYDIRSIKTREFKNVTTLPAAAGGGSADTTSQQKWTNQIITAGFRPHVNALGGEWFAGAGFAMVLPFETTSTATFTNPNAAWTGAGLTTWTTQETVKKYNMAFGAYGELGYKFMFTDNIGLNLGLRAVVATANNIDQTKVVTNNGTPVNGVNNTTQTTTYKESYSATQNTTEGAANTAAASKSLASFETLGITDFSANVGISLKF